ATPVAAFIADATVAEAVVDATVETDVRAPVASMEDEGRAAPSPIPGGPEIAIAGADGLRVDRQRRGAKADRDDHLGAGRGRGHHSDGDGYSGGQHQETRSDAKWAVENHVVLLARESCLRVPAVPGLHLCGHESQMHVATGRMRFHFSAGLNW